MNRKPIFHRRGSCRSGAARLVPACVFRFTFAESSPYAAPLPTATPPEELAVFSLMTGVNHRVAAYGYRRGSLFERREFSIGGPMFSPRLHFMIVLLHHKERLFVS